MRELKKEIKFVCEKEFNLFDEWWLCEGQHFFESFLQERLEGTQND